MSPFSFLCFLKICPCVCIIINLFFKKKTKTVTTPSSAAQCLFFGHAASQGGEKGRRRRHSCAPCRTKNGLGKCRTNSDWLGRHRHQRTTRPSTMCPRQRHCRRSIVTAASTWRRPLGAHQNTRDSVYAAGPLFRVLLEERVRCTINAQDSFGPSLAKKAGANLVFVFPSRPSKTRGRPSKNKKVFFFQTMGRPGGPKARQGQQRATAKERY